VLIHSFSIFFFNKPLHFLFLWQFKLVFGNEKPVVHAGQSILHKRMISLGAKQNAHRRVVSLGHHVLFVPAYLGIELADAFMAELLEFQFHQYVALENAVIEDQVHKSVSITDENTLLAGLKAEPMPEFQKKLL